jgi:hypothetical protein
MSCLIQYPGPCQQFFFFISIIEVGVAVEYLMLQLEKLSTKAATDADSVDLYSHLRPKLRRPVISAQHVAQGMLTFWFLVLIIASYESASTSSLVAKFILPTPNSGHTIGSTHYWHQEMSVGHLLNVLFMRANYQLCALIDFGLTLTLHSFIGIDHFEQRWTPVTLWTLFATSSFVLIGSHLCTMIKATDWNSFHMASPLLRFICLLLSLCCRMCLMIHLGEHLQTFSKERSHRERKHSVHIYVFNVYVRE